MGFLFLRVLDQGTEEVGKSPGWGLLSINF